MGPVRRATDRLLETCSSSMRHRRNWYRAHKQALVEGPECISKSHRGRAELHRVRELCIMQAGLGRTELRTLRMNQCGVLKIDQLGNLYVSKLGSVSNLGMREGQGENHNVCSNSALRILALLIFGSSRQLSAFADLQRSLVHVVQNSFHNLEIPLYINLPIRNRNATCWFISNSSR
jgi:hypothetical protein